MGVMIWALVALVVTAILRVMVANARRRPHSGPRPAPAVNRDTADEEPEADADLQLDYEKKKSVFTPAERNYYEVLRRVVAQQYVIFGKIRMIDLLQIKAGGRDYYKAKGQVVFRHADFVLLEPKSIAPVLVIELDDASHQRAKVQEFRCQEGCHL